MDILPVGYDNSNSGIKSLEYHFGLTTDDDLKNYKIQIHTFSPFTRLQYEPLYRLPFMKEKANIKHQGKCNNRESRENKLTIKR